MLSSNGDKARTVVLIIETIEHILKEILSNILFTILESPYYFNYGV